MTQETVETAGEPQEAEASLRPRRWPRVLGLVVLVLAFLLAVAWLNREKIADNIIGNELEKAGLPARYKITEIGPGRQVLTDLVIGDPVRPDLTIERAEVAIAMRLGWPSLGEIKLVRPMLYGSYRNGKLSFGSLDKVLFEGEPQAPFRLPDMELALEDARARIDGDMGPVGIKLEGKGNLRSGFAGEIAAIALRLSLAGCTAEGASLYGRLETASEKPKFKGPLRLASLACTGAGASLRQAAVQVDGTVDADLRGADARMVPLVASAGYGDARLDQVGGSVDLTYRKQALTARYDLKARALASPQLSASAVSLKGMVRGADALARLESDGTLDAANLQMGRQVDGALASAQGSAKGTLGEPLLAQLRGALARHAPGSRLRAEYLLRQTGQVTNLIVPQAAVTGGTGQVILAVSSLQLVSGGAPAPRVAGNFTTGGVGMPRITGRMERRARGTTLIRMAMADYAARDARLALPELALAQAADGTIGFVGKARSSGAIPGGRVQDLELPIDGRWVPGREFEVWRGCRQLRFASLTYAGLVLNRDSLDLCPGAGGAIVRSGGRGTAISARAARIELAGRLKQTPITIASGAATFSNPGTLSADNLVVTLGQGESPVRFAIGTLKADVGREFSGTFADTQAWIGTVPLDIAEARGKWRFAAGRLNLSEGEFRLLDREQVDRFNPLVAQGAVLELADNRITAEALLRHPASGRPVVEAKIAHDLDTQAGSAGLSVPGITFDRQLQPDDLTPLALGVIADARGIVTGSGQVDWSGSTVSSKGTFQSEGLDFGAAFGPAKGVAGTVTFTDLLGLVTAPDQELRIASINPGIEAVDGRMRFELRPGRVLAINHAKWPFLDGTLELLPTQMTLGVAEVRRYVLKVEGISAERFIEQSEMANISATGLFDGALPLVFDENGGRVEGGRLASRPPGGNVSYIGELTYKDLSAMGNFAFEALRSLDYRTMQISLDGALAGQFVTRIRFDGISQGKAAKSNLITRQVARLPLRFNVNVRGPFNEVLFGMRLLTNPESLETYVRKKVEEVQQDATLKGLVPKNGPVLEKPDAVIQSPESEKKP
ncbi:YdbH domain-containing protein [Novosphingobium sp. TH158]|uniref:YdbH domain-containing protein n=1 Tax=Novosphingobium sp. TH158 TaxID=2067455 RepID=UPI000C7BEE63|nr:YdbH domain-containing protein [Novosphingobium sp. TH158]PLK24281.1 C4-dicarboxylate ABC transporter [Novosphingobium sp. TH158]